MIVRLRGNIERLLPTSLELEVNGITYFIEISLITSTELQGKKEVTLEIAQIIKEDSNLLYGFISREDREIFLRIIKINGIHLYATECQLLGKLVHHTGPTGCSIAVKCHGDIFPGILLQPGHEVLRQPDGRLERPGSDVLYCLFFQFRPVDGARVVIRERVVHETHSLLILNYIKQS